jgi:hypothetical protein
MLHSFVEAFAIRAALGNNGGTWAEHYTEEQKEHWRQFIRDLVSTIEIQRAARLQRKGEAR